MESRIIAILLQQEYRKLCEHLVVNARVTPLETRWISNKKVVWTPTGNRLTPPVVVYRNALDKNKEARCDP